MKRTSIFAAPLLLVAILSVFIGCEDDDDNPAAPAPTGRVMAVHASPNAPLVDILVDGAEVAGDVPFLANTAYLSVPTGSRQVRVTPANTPGTIVLQQDFTIADGISYTVFAADSLASIEYIALQDDLSAPPAGQAKVRFVHLSPNAPAVDVVNTAGGAILFANTVFKASKPFANLPAGTYNLTVNVAGTSTVALNLPGVTLTAGKIYTVYARGFLGGAGAQALGATIIANN